MGGCLSTPADEVNDARSGRRVQGQDGRPSGEHIRLFLIGNGEVGKSTLIKQMQKLCLTVKGYSMYNENWNPIEPFSVSERKNFSVKIQQNIFRMIGTLIMQVARMDLQHSSSKHGKYAQEIIQEINGELETLHKREVHLTPQLAEKITALWTKDSGINAAWNRRREFLISDSAEYFLAPGKLEEISAPDYCPSVDDILRVRDPTTGIRDYNFRLHKVHFTIHDMGGQPIERARIPVYIETWLQGSRPGDRNFILYVAALSDYNQTHPLYPEKTVLDESVGLLQVLLNMQQLRDSGFILFLNKRDIFEKKIQTFKDFNRHFHDYLKARNASQTFSLSQAEKVVASRFADAVNNTARPDEQLYCRFTTAVDTEMMETIFHTVKNDIINDIVKHGNWAPFP